MKVAARLMVLVEPASDLPGQWVAHCLNLDIVTQGNSIRHAFEMVAEAIGMTVTEDLAQGRNPFERPRAPAQEWALAHFVLANHQPLSSIENEACVGAVVGFVSLDVAELHALPGLAPEIGLIPPAWLLATLTELRGGRGAGSAA